MKNQNIDKSQLPIFLFHQGTNYNAYDFLGAHLIKKDGKNGTMFRVWAPNAKKVAVVGDFNCWNDNSHVMNRISDNGIYELFIEGVKQYDCYKYSISNNNKTFLKADPYAFHSESPSKTASKVYDIEGFNWTDTDYIKNKQAPYDKPMNIYELNLASWKRHEDGNYYTYREYAKELTEYVYNMGYTHVEFMPLTEYPFDGSWGYQVTGYFSITSRFGTPKDFMYLVDCIHSKGIGVILDWVPAHFPKDEHGLFQFDGSNVFENSIPTRRENKGWGTMLFDWGKNEVQSFLISSAIFLFEKYHIDGIRVDAVASMLYLDYDKKDGEWVPNEFGGNYNIQAIEFFKKLNKAVFEKFPNALMIAEESTSFPMITKPVYMGGLGFNFKWNMGWMNDSLSYVEIDPYFRSGSHNKLTFPMCYAFSENFILPISHDEVVHGKKSLLDKMPGSIEDKFSNLRAFNAYMYSHPGKKLTFMGNEYGQFKEWNYKEGLEFFMLKFDLHKKLHKYNKKLNFIYKENPELYEIEDSWDGFDWIIADGANDNLIAFTRRDRKGGEIISIINFSGNNYTNYFIGASSGQYKIILCSDDKQFGGQGIITKKTLKTKNFKMHGKEATLKVQIPRFTALYLKKI